MSKGEYDIRLVYDIAALILNAALWSLTFWMPLLDNVLGVATHLSWFGDIDAAEMFHKYKISESMQPLAGVDLYWAEKGNKLHW